MSFLNHVAFAVVLAAAPLAAQSTNEATPPPATTAPAPTPSPPPAGDAVGPPQLRDFNLNGVVTQPAQPATPAPAPVQTPAPAPRETSTRTTAAPATTAPAPRQPAIAAPDSDPSPGEVTVDLPPSTAAPLAPETSLSPEPVIDPTPAADAPEAAWWPWLAALVAVSLCAGFLWWRRRQRGSERYATDHPALGALVATPEPTPEPLPRAMPTPPRPAPRPTPPAAPAPAPVPAPIPAPQSDGIIASRLKPELAFELVPIRAEADAAEGAALTVDLVVINRGSAPARDVLIETHLVNAGAQVDAAVGRFFARAAGNGQRLPVIAPMSRVSIRTRLAAASAEMAPLVVQGRKLFVPVVAVNAHYRWGAGEVTESSSFLVGRGDADGGKMAPFRLDLGPRSWSDLGARLHSSGLERV